jgi:hypothetical protein
MSTHASQFDDHLSKAARNEAMGLSPDAGRHNKKVREGKVRVCLVVCTHVCVYYMCTLECLMHEWVRAARNEAMGLSPDAGRHEGQGAWRRRAACMCVGMYTLRGYQGICGRVVLSHVVCVPFDDLPSTAFPHTHTRTHTHTVVVRWAALRRC